MATADATGRRAATAWLGPATAIMLSAGPALAETHPAAAQATVGHTVAKTITLKLGANALLFGIFYAGTGSMMDTGALAAISNIGATAIYAANEYLWDRYYPNINISANAESFSAFASLRRNTWKYLTFKPAVTAFSWGSIYLYTGSVSAMATMGTAAFVSFPVVFFANNLGWDWYDWYSNGRSAQK